MNMAYAWLFVKDYYTTQSLLKMMLVTGSPSTTKDAAQQMDF